MVETHTRPDRTALVPPGQSLLMPDDMTAIFSADITLAQAQTKLAEIAQWLPVDGHPDLPLGRLVEENSSSPLRLGYGAWRDLLLGMQFANGRDQLISAGGITMKNVAGYDLTKFMVGQHGVFGRIVTLATRTYRRPAGAIHAAFQATDILPSLLPTSLRPQWSILTPCQLLLGYVGNEATLDYYERELPAIAPASLTRQTIDADITLRSRLWSGVQGGDHSPSDPSHAGNGGFAETALPPSVPGNVIRVSLAPARVGAFLAALGPAHFAADPAFGVIRLFDTPIDRVAPLLSSFSARAAVSDGGRLINYNVSPEEQNLLQRLKAAFDPDGRLTALEFA